MNAGSTAVAAEHEPEVAPDPPAAGAAHEQQRAAGPHLAGGVARDLERQHRMVGERRAHLVGVHLEQRPVVGAAGRDQHVVDRTREPVEEALQRSRVVGVEGRGAPRVDVARRALEALGIAAGEDDVGALAAGASGGLQPDAGAAADDDDGLAEQLRFGPVDGHAT